MAAHAPMSVERIFISLERSGAQSECGRIRLEMGEGIVGDRNFGKRVYPGQNVTLVEAEEIERFCRAHGRAIDLSMTRRNLVTRGIRLNDLVGKKFVIGTTQLEGVELCEPCASLGKALADASLSAVAVIRHWTGRGGLRANIVGSGEIELGAGIEVIA